MKNIQRLLHDIFHIGPGNNPRLPYQFRERSGGLIWIEGWYQGRHGKVHVIIYLSHSSHWLFLNHWLQCAPEGSVNGRSMKTYYGTSKSSTIWLPNRNKLKEKSRDLNRNSSRYFFQIKMKQCSVADKKTVRSLEF